MNERTDLDRLLTAWLTADAPIREPEPLLGRVLARTARTRRRAAWRIPERWFPMSTITSHTATVTRFPWRMAGVVALLIVGLAVATAVFIGTRPRALPAPFGPAANGVLIYGRDGDIVSAADPTASARTIVGGPDRDALAWLSPLGRRFVFVKGDPASADAALWAADADGSNARRLASAAMIGWVEWSPTEESVAILKDSDTTAIILVRADGTGSSVIATGLPTVMDVIWRPSDGRQLLFRGQDTAGDWGLYLIDADGSNMRRLDLDPGFRSDPGYASSVELYFQAPVWSPDGRSIAYATRFAGGPGLQVRVADVDETGTVGASREIGDPSRASQFGPTFLPNGKGIVFQEVVDGRVSLMYTDIAAGSTPRDLHAGGGGGFNSVTISPDGAKVLTLVAPDDAAWLTDVASGTSTSLGYSIHDAVTWQRLAP